MGKTASAIKNSKPFYLADTVVYALLAAAIALLFLTAFARDTDSSDGFYILYGNETAAVFDFSDGTLAVKDGYGEFFSVGGDGIYFFPDPSDENEFNLILVNAAEKTVVITRSTCTGHDCEKQKISDGKGFIYCAPHKLKIIPAGLSDPVTG